MRKDYYKNNAKEYIEVSKFYDLTDFYKFLENELVSFNNPKILDLGFGAARDMKYLSQKYNVIGVDSCQAFIDNALEQDLNVMLQTLPSLDTINESMDLIYSVGVIFHLNKEERLELFKNVRDKLNKNGKLVLSYNILDRSNDKDREFFILTEEEVNEEVGLEVISREIISDKRGFKWITVTYAKRD